MKNVDSIESVRELALFAGTGGGILGGVLRGWRTVCAVEIEAYCRAVICSRQNDGSLAPFPVWDDVRTFDGRPWRGIADVVSGGFPCQDISAAGKGVGIEGSRSGLWKEMHRIIGEVRPRYAFMENSPMLTSRGLGRVLGDLAEIGYDAEWTCLSASDCGAPHKRERIWILARDSNCNDETEELTIRHRENSEPGGVRGYVPNPARGEDERGERGDVDAPPRGRQGRDAAASARGTNDTDPDRVRKLQPKGIIADKRGWASNMGQEVPDATSIGRKEPRQNLSVSREGPKHDARFGVLPDVSDSPHDGDVRRELVAKNNNGEHEPDGGGAKLDVFRRWWSAEPGLGRVANGVAHRVDRLKAIGNGQVPIVAARAFGLLMDRFIFSDNQKRRNGAKKGETK